MAELIDIILVGGILVFAVYHSLKYLSKIMTPPPLDQPAACAGCELDCEVKDLGLQVVTSHE